MQYVVGRNKLSVGIAASIISEMFNDRYADRTASCNESFYNTSDSSIHAAVHSSTAIIAKPILCY
jgi:galactitol-specific phosphotransferase system IIC component